MRQWDPFAYHLLYWFLACVRTPRLCVDGTTLEILQATPFQKSMADAGSFAFTTLPLLLAAAAFVVTVCVMVITRRRRLQLRLQGSIAVITGGGSGIGR